MQIIKEFYDAQQKVIETLNKQFHYFEGKLVNIIITDTLAPALDRTIKNVFYRRFEMIHGMVYLHYDKMKKDGTPSSMGGDIYIDGGTNIQFVLVKDEEK